MVTSTLSTPAAATTNHFKGMSDPRFETSVSGGISDFEVARRVVAIRSQWSSQERAHRKNEAKRRYEALLAALHLDEASTT